MNAEIQNELDLIKESVLQVVPAEAIYLFGSYAYGTPHKDSDLDIYVVIPDNAPETSELNFDIRRLMWGKKTFPLDLHMCRTSVFNQRKNWPTLQKVVAQRGVVLHGYETYS